MGGGLEYVGEHWSREDGARLIQDRNNEWKNLFGDGTAWESIVETLESIL